MTMYECKSTAEGPYNYLNDYGCVHLPPVCEVVRHSKQ